MYVANPFFITDIGIAVDWMLSQGVQVINYSNIQSWEGPGDGTSNRSVSMLHIVDTAIMSSLPW